MVDITLIELLSCQYSWEMMARAAHMQAGHELTSMALGSEVEQSWLTTARCNAELRGAKCLSLGLLPHEFQKPRTARQLGES